MCVTPVTLFTKPQQSAQRGVWHDGLMAFGDRLTGHDSSFLHLEDGPAWQPARENAG